MNTWNWNGARWWKCDFHAHTPASDDYGKGPCQTQLKAHTAKEWLLDHMRAEVDCVAITDHNSGLWIDRLKQALRELDQGNPEGYRPVHLFPGVEISASGGVHVLAVFGVDKATADIDSLLGADRRRWRLSDVFRREPCGIRFAMSWRAARKPSNNATAA